jgi:hypothetical protein
MEKKYYWMSFEREKIKIEEVTDVHPFITITKMRNHNPLYGTLLNWKEISAEEYVLFNDILFNINKPEYNY